VLHEGGRLRSGPPSILLGRTGPPLARLGWPWAGGLAKTPTRLRPMFQLGHPCRRRLQLAGQLRQLLA
jgi:hypothetical protein